MRKVNSFIILIALAIVVVVISGCGMTYSARIKDGSDIYKLPMIPNAPKIVLADLTDNRVDKKKVGIVGMLNLTSQTSINVVLTNRIAMKLRDAGFNVQKMPLSKPKDKAEIIETIKFANGDVLLTGGLDNFFIASFDAVMEKGKGTVTFYIKIFDKEGNAIFNKNYSGYAENWIGLTGQFGCEKLIEQSIQASADEIFKDREFNDMLAKIKK